MPVSPARPELSPGISQTTRHTTYELFTPSKSGQRLHPTYYRGCWHVVSRCFFSTVPSPTRWASSRAKGVYNPKAVIPHAASLHQACAHCAIFPTAASRRSLGRVSVPMWPSTLSGRLPVAALVGHYPTNKLIGRGLIPHRNKAFHHDPYAMVVCGIRPSFPGLSHSAGQITHVLLTRSPLEYPPPRWRAFPFDLHVLSTPPAFVLSQDQTLQPQHTQKRVLRKQNKNKINSVSSVYLFDKSNTPPPPQGRGVRHPHNNNCVWVCVVLGTLLSSHTTKKRYCQRFSRCPLIFYVGLRVEE